MNIGYDSYESILGKIYVVADEAGIRKLEVIQENWDDYFEKNPMVRNPHMCYNAIKQLDEYFAGKRKKFEIDLSIEGTEFRKKVWNALLDIPYGEIRSYSDIANSVGNPKAVRAVGQANRANPLPIFIPCHRVIGKDNKLTGYAGTRIDIKDILLKLEGVII